VLERVIEDGMSIERILESLRREFLLELSTGFVYDVLHDHARHLDMSVHRRKVLELFSGTLCIDELHLVPRPTKSDKLPLQPTYHGFKRTRRLSHEFR